MEVKSEVSKGMNEGRREGGRYACGEHSESSVDHVNQVFSKRTFVFAFTSILVLSAAIILMPGVVSGSEFSNARILTASHEAEVSTSSQTYETTALDAGMLSVATTSNVFVYYTAEGSITNPDDIIRIRCGIGDSVANISDIKFVDYSMMNVTQSAVFYIPDVTVTADSTIKIEFRSSTGDTVKLRNQTLVAVAYPTTISMAGYSTEDKETMKTTYGTENVWQAGTLEVPTAAKGLFFYSAEGNVLGTSEVLHVRCNASNNIANIEDIRLVDYSTMNVTRGGVFYMPSLSADSYTIKLGYRSSTGDGIALRNQTLAAVAFPALVKKEETEKNTSSPDYVEALDAGTLSLDTTSDVAVYYSAEGSISDPDDILRINCTIGGEIASISDIKFVDSSTNNVTMSAVFYRSNLDTGSYPIKIGYRSSNGNDNEVTLRNQTLIAISQKAAPPPVPVPEFNPVGLLALIGMVSAVLAVATMRRREK